MITSRITLQDGTQIIPDTLDTATHTVTAEATDHPVEDGSALSDNIVRKPRTVSMVLTFSPFPVRTDTLTPAGDSRPDQAFDALAGAMERRERVYAMIDGKFYTPAAITSLTMPRAFTDGSSRTINLELKEILTAYARTAAKLAPKARLKSKMGKKIKAVGLARSDAAILAGVNLASGNLGTALGYITGAVL
jgi:hypothetical protein